MKFSTKKMGVNFFPAKKTKPGGGSEGSLVKDHTFAAFFFVHPSLMKMIIFEKIQLKFYVSTKSIVIVIIELDILVVQVSSNLGCKGRSYLGDERYFLDKDDVSNKFIVIFIIDFEFFIHLLYDKLWGLPRRVFTLFWTMTIFEKNPLSFSS